MQRGQTTASAAHRGAPLVLGPRRWGSAWDGPGRCTRTRGRQPTCRPGTARPAAPLRGGGPAAEPPAGAIPPGAARPGTPQAPSTRLPGPRTSCAATPHHVAGPAFIANPNPGLLLQERAITSKSLVELRRRTTRGLMHSQQLLRTAQGADLHSVYILPVRRRGTCPHTVQASCQAVPASWSRV